MPLLAWDLEFFFFFLLRFDRLDERNRAISIDCDQGLDTRNRFE